MNDYQYTLDPSSRKYLCPSCGKKRFVRYVDRTTGNYLPPQYGKCDRIDNCSYNLNPYKEGYAKRIHEREVLSYGELRKNFIKSHLPIISNKTISLIPDNVFLRSLAGYKHNNFIQYLSSLFDISIVDKLIIDYNIGSSKHWPGSTVFWQLSLNGEIRAGKIMLYDSLTGRRVKEPFNHITWVHTCLKLNNFSLNQCFFGEHLLKESKKPAAIVESEKTAIIASAYFPQFIWLAVGGKEGLSSEKCKVLQGRLVVLFPDLNGYNNWSQTKIELTRLIPNTNFVISDLLEKNALETDIKLGYDLADYLAQFDHSTFIEPKIVTVANDNCSEPLLQVSDIQEYKTLLNESQNSVNEWDIDSIEKYYQNVMLSDEPLKINSSEIIINLRKFIQSHIAVVKNYYGNPNFKQYYNRLIQLKNNLIANPNEKIL